MYCFSPAAGLKAPVADPQLCQGKDCAIIGVKDSAVQITPSTRIKLVKRNEAAWGVFASAPFLAGEVVEECPVYVLEPADSAAVEKSGGDLVHYLFAWGKDGSEDQCAIAFGFASLYNHSSTPNVCLSRDPEHKILRFVALREIRTHEEICFDYAIPLWFKPSEEGDPDS
jgi:hypothetical protein